MESNLSLTYQNLVDEVAQFLGYSTSNATQQSVIDSIVRSGLRQFYFPPPTDGASGVYDWSFLKPTATLNFASGASVIPLPDDFGGIEGQLTVSTSDSTVFWPVPIVGEGQVRQCYSAYPEATGRPAAAAIRPIKGTTPTAGQRFELYLHPTADAAYTLQVTYYILPDYLTGATPYAYGGAMHAETILESCLAIAEQRLDDASAVHSAKFQERLAASIGLDRRKKPQTLGYNRDRSDGVRWLRGDRHGEAGIRVYGVQY